MANYWVARDAFTGAVHLFDRKPVNDCGLFYASTNNGEGLPLGKRPKLPFTLKRGQCRKVGIKIVITKP